MANSTPSASSSSSSSSTLLDRVAIVTGASRGIGRAIAVHLFSLGARVVLGYSTNPSLAADLAAELNSSCPSSSARAITARVDVSSPDDVRAVFDLAEQTFHTKPHILVNSAGILDASYPSLASTSIEEFDATLSVNTRGAFLCLREAAARLVRGGGGRIVLLSSSVVASAIPGFGAYAASKAAVEMMVRVAAKEMAGTGITANCVAPGPVASDMFFAGKDEAAVARAVASCPMGRLGEVGDIAPVVGFLASDAAGWINGQVICVNGG